MKRLVIILGLIIACITGSDSMAAAKGYAELYKAIEGALKLSDDSDINVGVYIKDLTTGDKFSYHGRRMFGPASVVKLFTTYAALTYLGPEYRFKTYLLANKPQLQAGKLSSDIMVQFSGDPSLTFENLRQLFAKADVKKIEGNVIIDGTIFDENHSAPGGFTWDDRPFYYASPKSAIVVNKNCSRATMMPSARLGQKAQLVIEEPSLLNIENNVLTVAPRKNECEFKSRYLGANKYEVYGCMFQDMHQPVKLHFALQDNRTMIIRYIEEVFKDLGIQFFGKFIFKKNELRANHMLAVHESAPLRELLVEILSHSCNVYASALFKAMAAKYYGSTADYEMSEEILKNLLKQAGLRGQFILKDGAGESHHNMLTPEVTVNLLDLIYKKDPAIKNLFIKSLAQYGSDGSLSNRSLGAKLDKYIYAKTGSSNAISALGGYYLPTNGHAYAFAIMINNHNIPRSEVKALEDKILMTTLHYFVQHKHK